MLRESEADLAYIAGLFDGEGTIGVYPHGDHAGWRMRVQLHQNHSPGADLVMQALKDTWGGSLYIGRYKGVIRGQKYDVCGKRALAFLIDIEPYVRIKREQLLIAINWQTNRLPRRQHGAGGRFVSYIGEKQEGDDAAVAAKLVELKNKLAS